MNGFNKGWYVIYTRPQQEKKLADSLTRLGIECYLPLLSTVSLRRGRKKKMEKPVFPSYVFAMLSSLSEYFVAYESPSFCYYVKVGRQSAMLSNTIIEQIKIALDSSEEVDVVGGSFVAGQSLLISQGPLKGLLGEMIEYNGKNKILVRVQLLNRNLVVNIPERVLSDRMSFAGNTFNH